MAGISYYSGGIMWARDNYPAIERFVLRDDASG
jgi:hypothetical protein